MARIIERERPDALLPTLGGQTALNLAKALHDDGTLERFGVELIGADYEAIHRAEDREEFRKTMEAAGLRVPWSLIVESVGDVEAALADGTLELPAIVRPGVHAGRPGRRRRRGPRPSCARSSPRASPPARSTRSWSRSRCSAGASSSSR